MYESSEASLIELKSRFASAFRRSLTKAIRASASDSLFSPTHALKWALFMENALELLGNITAIHAKIKKAVLYVCRIALA